MCQNEPGYVRYVVPASDFTAQMQSLQKLGLRGKSVSEALADPESPGAVITFDDGCETDLVTAAPLLRELGFCATFYATVGFLDKRGYLTRSQLRELSDLGMEIGSHSMTHPYLPDLSDEDLAREIAASKAELEEITGHPVHHFSCPGGRWDERVAAQAQRSGYRSVSTSRIAANSAGTNLFRLGRVAIMRGTTVSRFHDLAQGQGLTAMRFMDAIRNSARKLLGNTFYDRLRARVLTK
jgi:peptidoglycan/xylan/chitin deacetylase (PgdA/CDA1 family)